MSIPPGRYISTTAHSGCYWERLSGLGGTLGEILANDFQNFTGQAIVDVRATDIAFKFNSSCGTFKTYVAPVSQTSTIVPGAHVVGAELTSGTYVTQSASGCYWERTSSFDGTLNSIIANDYISSAGTQYVTISASDTGFITNQACGTWQHT